MFSANTSQVAAGGGAVFVEDIFSTTLYTGNSSTQTITNGIDLAGDGGLVWTKSRTEAGRSHALFDTTRGINAFISSNLTSNFTVSPSGDAIASFNSNGYTLGADTGNWGVNNSANGNLVSWTFREQPKFFDVVTYTGNGTTQTLSHNLGSAPGFIIVKAVSGATAGIQRWTCYHQSLGASYAIWLNLSDASFNMGAGVWGNNTTTVTPSSTTFTVGADDWVNSASNTYVAYLFAHNAGGFGLTSTDNVISCGSFTTDGSSNFSVNLGYEPQWILAKQATGSANNWCLFDNMRGMSNTNVARIIPNSSAAETDFAAPYCVPSATGFYSNSGGFFDASQTVIYIAIRRGPMKVPTSGTSVFSNNLETSSANPQTLTTGFPVDMNISALRSPGTTKYVMDRLRGSSVSAGVTLYTNATNAELATSGLGFQNNTGLVDNGWWNTSGAIFWSFGRAPSFFDEVCYTGTGTAGQTYTHNLGVVPELMIVKSRSLSQGWLVYSATIGNTNYLRLNSNAAFDTSTLPWNDTSPTSSVFTLGTASNVNGSGSTYVAYLFATCAGVSKVGSYTGTGATQTINCGFTGGARFVLIKKTSGTGSWYVWDSARGIVSGNDPYLLLNSTAAEVTSTDYIDTYSAGFEISSTAPSEINENGGSFIFLAIS